MTHYSDATRKKVVQQHIQDGRTIKSLAAEYGVSTASISNQARDYRKECQSNNEEKSQLELIEEVRKLRLEKAELEKENDFLIEADRRMYVKYLNHEKTLTEIAVDVGVEYNSIVKWAVKIKNYLKQEVVEVLEIIGQYAGTEKGRRG